MNEKTEITELEDEFNDFKNRVYYRHGEMIERIEKIEKQLKLKPRERGMLGEVLMEEI